MKSKKYHTVGTISKFNRKIVESGTINIPNTEIHDCTLSWLSTGTSIKSGGVKLVLMPGKMGTILSFNDYKMECDFIIRNFIFMYKICDNKKLEKWQPPFIGSLSIPLPTTI